MSASMSTPRRATEARNRGIAMESMAPAWAANGWPRRRLWACPGWGWGLAGVLGFVFGRRGSGLSLSI